MTTEFDKANALEVFARRKRLLVVLRVVLTLLTVAYTLTTFVDALKLHQPYKVILAIVTVFLILGYSFFRRKFWVCPVCHEPLSGRLDIDRCPKCGTAFE